MVDFKKVDEYIDYIEEALNHLGFLVKEWDKREM